MPALSRHGIGAAPKGDSNKRRILVIEDHPIVALALEEILNFEKDLHVCGVAQDYASALDKIAALNPELVTLDLTLHGRGGLDLLKDIKARYPKVLILVLSMHEESIYAPRSIRAGAAGYVMKQEPMAGLVQAIRRVLNGEIYVSPAMEKKMMRLFARGGAGPMADPLEALTDRELEVFRLIGQGKGTREIARLLRLSVKTIESHRAHIREKLDVKSAGELVQHAMALDKARESDLPPALDQRPSGRGSS